MKPILSIGESKHVPHFEQLLFFGFFTAVTENRQTLPVAQCEGYFFDLRRGKGALLPYYTTNVDCSFLEHADSVSLSLEHPNDQLNLIPEIVYKATIEGVEREIWRTYLPTKWTVSISQAFEEFARFFNDTPYAISL